jgi:hypothetical protein
MNTHVYLIHADRSTEFGPRQNQIVEYINAEKWVGVKCPSAPSGPDTANGESHIFFFGHPVGGAPPWIVEIFGYHIHARRSNEFGPRQNQIVEYINAEKWVGVKCPSAPSGPDTANGESHIFFFGHPVGGAPPWIVEIFGYHIHARRSNEFGPRQNQIVEYINAEKWVGIKCPSAPSAPGAANGESHIFFFGHPVGETPPWIVEIFGYL